MKKIRSVFVYVMFESDCFDIHLSSKLFLDLPLIRIHLTVLQFVLIFEVLHTTRSVFFHSLEPK